MWLCALKLDLHSWRPSVEFDSLQQSSPQLAQQHINTPTHQHRNTPVPTPPTPTQWTPTHIHTQQHINTPTHQHTNTQTHQHSERQHSNTAAYYYQHIINISIQPHQHCHITAATHQHINSSTHRHSNKVIEHINTSTHQHIKSSTQTHQQHMSTRINASTYQHINTQTCQHISTHQQINTTPQSSSDTSTSAPFFVASDSYLFGPNKQVNGCRTNLCLGFVLSWYGWTMFTFWRFGENFRT